MKRKFYFVEFEPANTFSGVRAKPFDVPFAEEDVKSVWTLYRRSDKNEPPPTDIIPVHHQNAFREDYIHDWNIYNGKFRYASRVTDEGVWILVELK